VFRETNNQRGGNPGHTEPVDGPPRHLASRPVLIRGGSDVPSDSLVQASLESTGALLPALRKQQRAPIWEPRRPSDAWFERRREQALMVALMVPTSGSAGIWGPSTIACAQLAAEEINRADGLLGQEIRLRVVDAADDIVDLAERTTEMLDNDEIDAI